MAAECIKTIKLRMRACLRGRQRARTARHFPPKRLQESRHARQRHSWAPGGGDVHHESDDICDVESKERLKTRRRDPDGVRSRSQA